ncbi:MAG: bifunctional (p)ppGpp synthetase/guanosine-3',5'-bis(diphosphate) 3'-pyrophosphohydrolase [Candidatus Schekmanbacteria bacterium]|nr:bifunctional (p)ppGpp synthetase/guanosine-3',5'-bis(diphosphate) 3'-pyrophosphohydrolase [Candidatus Schekmanbacteria bacterium]
MAKGKAAPTSIEELVRTIPPSFTAEDCERLLRCDTAAHSVGRAGLEAIEIAGILLEIVPDPIAAAAALFMPLPSATEAEAITERLRDEPLGEITRLLLDVGKIEDAVRVLEESKAAGKVQSAEQVEVFRKMLLAMARDVRAVLLVLAHRMQALRHARELGEQVYSQLARTALSVYAPLANRLGVWQIKWELEDLSLRALEPETYKGIGKALAQKRDEREAFVREVRDILAAKLAEAGIAAEISGRPKHIYSIYNKMMRKDVGLDQIYDTHAVRLLVPGVNDCYAALGCVHSLWNPVPGEFDDYIAAPKANGYQSLHTAVIGPGGRPVEVQIRTREMHDVAEYGVATHWRYKEGSDDDDDREAGFADKIAHLRRILGWGAEIGESGALSEQVRAELFADEVYVFTPAGDVIDLPAGATVLDFAYAVHTNVGHRCRGAKLNGKLVSLTTTVATGDVVEVLTRKQQNPSRDWLNPALGFLRSRRSLAKVRSWFRKHRREESIAAGRQMVERELKRLAATALNFESLARLLAKESAEELFAAVGYGDIALKQVVSAVQRVQHQESEAEAAEAEAEAAASVVETPQEQRQRQKSVEGTSVRGLQGLLTVPARCCEPIPGDVVIGFVTRGRGITIHRRTCSNVVNTQDAGRFIEVEWAATKRDGDFRTSVEVEADSSASLVRDLTAAIGDEGGRITDLHAKPLRSRWNVCVHVSLGVRDREHLDKVLLRVQRLAGVIKAYRR